MIESSRSRVLSEKDVRVSAAPIRVGGQIETPKRGAKDCKASVREVRDKKGSLTEIHVQCSCGNTTVVACEYTG